MGSKREKISQFARVVESIARPFFSLVEFLLPIIISQCRFIYSAYSKLPHDAVAVLIGIVFCFFGGLYPTLFSAAQAAKHSGLSTLRVGLGDLANEAIFIIEESKKDDDKDDDGDGGLVGYRDANRIASAVSRSPAYWSRYLASRRTR